MVKKFYTVVLCLPLLSACAIALPKPSAEERTAHYLESVRKQPLMLLALLRKMPKGGDLHNHLAGALEAENLIDWAAADGLCVERGSGRLTPAPCDAACDQGAKPEVRCAYRDQSFYNAIVDAWSMRNWERGHESGHDHFFATFDKFFPATYNHIGEAIAGAASQAAEDRLQYVELMHTADGTLAMDLAKKLDWDESNFPKMRKNLLELKLGEVTAATREKLTTDERTMKSALKCGTPRAEAACDVTVRYLYQVLRGLDAGTVFSQLVLGFELAEADSRFVGVNLVMPEDWYIPMRDFDLHMRMLDYLHGVYPGVHIALHAGELAPGLVPPDGLRFHVRESLKRGHAERIGHGTSVGYEDDAIDLLREMAKRNILVEICLTSNDLILGVRGDDHPFMIYRSFGVPVTLASDDEGVSRSDLTHEYFRAARAYGLSYADLKSMARESLEHSFLPGASLWRDGKNFVPVGACATHGRHVENTSAGCRKFLSGSERANLQWKLESEFAKFEGQY